jgi:SAM-dependent methyltransferase
VEEERIKKAVREGYAKIATKSCSCCNPANSQQIGYTPKDLKSVPEGADLGLGCGNPIALASLKKGEAVLDLGSGGGLDCFIAANKVGETGKAIGVDMTPEMIDKARKNARNGHYKNVEFRLGEIENLPVANNAVDVIISNCVINLSTDKRRVFEEAFRVLKPGGRLMISDIVLLKKLPDALRRSKKAYVGCISGAIMKNEYVDLIRQTGFREVQILEETHFPIEYATGDTDVKTVAKSLGIPVGKLGEAANSVVSIKICGTKPR